MVSNALGFVYFGLLLVCGVTNSREQIGAKGAQALIHLHVVLFTQCYPVPFHVR